MNKEIAPLPSHIRCHVFFEVIPSGWMMSCRVSLCLLQILSFGLFFYAGFEFQQWNADGRGEESLTPKKLTESFLKTKVIGSGWNPTQKLTTRHNSRVSCLAQTRSKVGQLSTCISLSKSVKLAWASQLTKLSRLVVNVFTSDYNYCWSRKGA